MPEKPSVTLPGTVNRVIPSLSPHNAGTVEISVHTAHDLYREVRIENTLTNESGGKVSLKLGSPVEVTITAEAGSATIQSGPPSSNKTPTTPVGRGESTSRQLSLRGLLENQCPPLRREDIFFGEFFRLLRLNHGCQFPSTATPVGKLFVEFGKVGDVVVVIAPILGFHTALPSADNTASSWSADALLRDYPCIGSCILTDPKFRHNEATLAH
jgi:hypothetical protein